MNFSKGSDQDRIQTTYQMVMTPSCYPLCHRARESLGKTFLGVNNFEKRFKMSDFFSIFQRKYFYIFSNCEKPKNTQESPAQLEIARNLIEIFAFMVQRPAWTCSPTFIPLKGGHFTLWIYLNLSFHHKIHDFKYQRKGVNTIKC